MSICRFPSSEEKARFGDTFGERKRERENWTCFLCFELNKVEENTTCKKCGQSKAASEKGKRLEDANNRGQ